METFVERMDDDQRFEFTDEFGVVTERQVGVDADLEHGTPETREATRFGLEGGLFTETVQGGSAPKGQRFPDDLRCVVGIPIVEEPVPSVRESGEARRVEIVFLDG